MGVFDKLIGRKKEAAHEAAEGVPCPHVTLVPRWDNAADMGHEDRASGFMCDSCKESFTAPQARALRRTEAERVKHDLEA